ncbi:DNA helicase [Desulfonema ishimotonii]|uniref:DNA 3'-5' helicase n=1 Tax=Desulfonema ishimotonii TaxID=45657 RepID=A0A401FUI5_9BACT|nr:UvrD-helicase domain-containing protein [Desulfonema ishimotonii]GBC60614.1 DNA helicase [Desulfonema ishimotonii]
MEFIADLHVHSRFSRATAKNLDLENLAIGAQLKGITVVATGDFTHPAWFAEIREKLVPAEPGLFRLRDDIAKACEASVPPACRRTVRFMLETEISNIYKKNGKTRKNHNLIYMPDLETAARLNGKLDAIGNIRSDGRPILGLDARNLLEIMLECSDDAMFIPAHIWTPWFSLLGSKSGFDSIQECFEDLSHEIFAVETGLSSDAPMNWRVSDLDTRTLISNSDAHSPANLGRNANRFDTELSFSAIRAALSAKDPAQCLGTLDMYPEEGKYHMDGHRKCDVCLRPSESMATDGNCPVCGKPLTLGVLHRVEALADRPEGVRPENRLPYQYIIPLPEILSEICQVGPKTKTVATRYRAALEALGPELEILLRRPLDEIRKAKIPLLDEAIRRMRVGEIHISPGYDGEYGRITVFRPEERETLLGQQALFDMPRSGGRKKKSPEKNTNFKPVKKKTSAKPPTGACPAGILDGLNPEQRQAVTCADGPLLIVAGPGTGKTRTLTHRIAWLIGERQVAPEHILAVTFTNKAAREMRERVEALMGRLTDGPRKMPVVGTFHALCLDILTAESDGDGGSVVDEEERREVVAEAVRQVRAQGIATALRPDALGDRISLAKQHLLDPDADLTPVAGEDAALLTAVYRTYQTLLARESAWDYDDLIFSVVRRFESDDAVREKYAARFRHILVDEYQDLNLGQYRLVRALSPPGKPLCVIGDPDQSVYGFRGSDLRYFRQFTTDYPEAVTLRLRRNYRSAEPILEASHQVIRDHSIQPDGGRICSGIRGFDTLTVMALPTERSEAVAIGKAIERMVGGTGFHSIDFEKTDVTGLKTDRAFSDFAVLYRSNAQSRVIADVFENAGIPFQIARREDVFGRKGVRELLAYLKIAGGRGLFSDFRKIIRMNGTGMGRKTEALFSQWFYENRLSPDRVLAVVGREPLPGLSDVMQRHLSCLVSQISILKTGMSGKSVREKLGFLLENTGLATVIRESARREAALTLLLRKADAFGGDTDGFLKMAALQNDPDVWELSAQKVTLMTLHAAKGLEFPVVFIAGCENGFLPFRGSPNRPVDTDEERRLFYVGLTRARERLFLTRAGRRTIYGKSEDREISPFVRDIEERLMTFEKNRGHRAGKKHPVQLGLFN